MHYLFLVLLLPVFSELAAKLSISVDMLVTLSVILSNCSTTVSDFILIFSTSLMTSLVAYLR
ncbi:hypothetical protein [Thermosipho africanus]|uniref:hypothetical protein n=1 Tax=Thermosipho africanus TaxID=2421 RepID=UPI0011C02FEE|nr:hypothetical protein [Thermosipho africanus]